MEEHFNENYMESDDFPKAYFIGIISDFSLDQLSNKVIKFPLKGTLTMHGVTNAIETEVCNLKK